ncbi:MAG: hypothetical protein AB2A00_34785, partial [Myxococcota bacterium]
MLPLMIPVAQRIIFSDAARPFVHPAEEGDPGAAYPAGMVTWSLALGFLVVAGAEPTRVQCPPGYGVVIEGNDLVCKPLPTTPPARGLKPAPTTPPPPPTTPPPTSPTSSPTAGADLRGLQSIPEICGLNRESDEVVEDTAEAM